MANIPIEVIPDSNSTGISADTNVTTAAARLYWLSGTAGATGGAWQVRNGTADTAAALLSYSTPASFSFHYLFEPPVAFATAIRLDIQGSNLLINVGWAPRGSF